MGCGIGIVKYLLFLFNFVFVLIGAALLGIGIYVTVSLGDYTNITEVISLPAISFIIIGSIVFIIAFFGCCGAIRESHCMVITYAVFLLTILIIQIALGVWAFVLGNNIETDEAEREVLDNYRPIFDKYWTVESDRVFVNTVQTTFGCCGLSGPSDFVNMHNGTIPWSCCGFVQDSTCSISTAYANGCVTTLIDAFKKALSVIGGVAVGVAVTELVGIVFALCLANSIKNDDRRGYRV